jgi:hypothetical protein
MGGLSKGEKPSQFPHLQREKSYRGETAAIDSGRRFGHSDRVLRRTAPAGARGKDETCE